MSKYIIEIEDEPFVRLSALFGEEGLYRAKGFNSLVFDQFGLDKLTPIDKALNEHYQRGLEEGKKQAKVQAHLDVCHDIDRVAHGNYQKGLDDAWEMAKYLFSEMSQTEIDLVFPQEWNNGGFRGLMALHPQDAIDRIKAYEEQQKIKVGDIITDGKINYLVIDITDNSYVALQGTDFEPSYIGKDYIKSYHNLHDSKDMRKIAEEISKAIKSEQRNCSTCKHLRFNSIECTECFSYKGYNKWEPKEGAE